MRSLAVWTTTAAVALFGAANANAQSTTSAPAATQSGDIVSAMTAYAAYQNDVTTLRSGTMGNANDLETALDTVAHHNRDALTRGWIAYGASTAAQSPAFVQGVRDAAAYYGRDAVIWALTVDPSYARGLRGGPEVTRMLLDSANADSARIINVADRYQELAYSLQRQRWANAVAPGQPARLTRVRSLGTSTQPIATLPSDITPRLSVATLSINPQSDPTQLGGRRFWDAVHGGANVVAVSQTAPAGQYRVNVTRGEALDRMASVAALEALNAVNDHQSAVSTLLADPRSRDCLEMAQLQLYQCMSAARFRYENAFCLGQHGLRDVGLCIGAVAQPDPAALPASAALPAATTTTR